MDHNMMERQIADYMVKYGTKNTDFGTWLFEVDKLEEEFNVTEKWIREHDDGILSELYLRDEVKDVEQQWGGIDWNIERIWVWFYTDFCPNYIEDDQKEDDGEDKYWFAKTRWYTDDIIYHNWFKNIIVEHWNEVLEDADFYEV